MSKKNQKTKILLVSYLFAPNNSIGAVRPSKFAKYLIRQGHDVTVLCVAPLKLTDTLSPNMLELNSADTICISHSNLYKFFLKILNGCINFKKKLSLLIKFNGTSIKQPKKTSIKQPKETSKSSTQGNISLAKNYIYFILSIIESFDWYMQVRKWFKTKKVNSQHYDLMLSSYGPLSSHWVGNFLNTQGISKLWFADFRDPMLLDSKPYYARKFLSKWQNDILRNASALTTVSEGMKNQILSTYEGEINACVISNGYDNEDITLDSITKIEFTGGKLHFGYTGTLYGGRRNLKPIFNALRELINEGYISSDKVCFHYAGTEGSILKNQAAAFSLESNVVDYGLVSRVKAQEIQFSCNLLVVATWNNYNERGVLTGKIFDYMRANVPIIALIAGDTADSELSQLVKQTNVGISYEEAND
ncbi:hypothetical protein, partial [Peribacillus butanolivorans]